MPKWPKDQYPQIDVEVYRYKSQSNKKSGNSSQAKQNWANSQCCLCWAIQYHIHFVCNEDFDTQGKIQNAMMSH